VPLALRKALPIFLIFALAAFLLLAHVGAPPLDEAEARSAIVSRHMLNTGQWVWPVPNKPFTCEKSPLVYWQSVPFAWLSGGMTELAARLPSVLWAFALLFLTWKLARHWHDDLAALFSAAALATSYGFIHWGRHGTVEMAQAAAILWCLWHFVKHRADAGRRWLYPCGLLVGLAANFGAWGAYGVVVLGALVVSAMARDWAWLRPARTVLLALLVSFAVFLALPLAASIGTGSAGPLRALWREHVLRHLQPLPRAYAWHFDLLGLVGFAAPWLVLAPISLFHDLWAWRRRGAGVPVATPVAGVVAAWLLLSSSTEPRRLLPIVPFASIIAGHVLARFAKGDLAVVARGAVRALVLAGGLLVLCLLGLSFTESSFGELVRWDYLALMSLVATAGLALVVGAIFSNGHAVLLGVGAIFVSYVAHFVPVTAERKEGIAEVAAMGKPIALLGEPRANVVFYLTGPYHVVGDLAAAEKWASETNGVVVGPREAVRSPWDSVVGGRTWMAMVWRPVSMAVSLTRDPAWLAKHPLRGLKSETLTYVFSAESGIRFDLGIVTMRLAREEGKDGRELAIAAQSKGGVYPMQSTITSRLRDSDLAQLGADDHRTRPSFKHRRFTWHPEGVDYHRFDHCKDPACRDPGHMVTGRDGRAAHCAEYKRCKKMEHRVWRLKEAFRDPGARDSWHVVAACYVARGFDLTPHAPPQVIRVINNQQMWDVALRGVTEMAITVPAGEFECVKLAFDATPVNKEAQESADEAEGPFGLTGHVELYVDKATRLLVLLDGEIELGAKFKVRVMLAKREAEAQP